MQTEIQAGKLKERYEVKDKSYSKTLHLQRPSKGGIGAKRLTFCGKKFETT